MRIQLFIFYTFLILVIVVRIFLSRSAPDLPQAAKLHATVRIVSQPQTSLGREELPVVVRGQRVRLVVPLFSEYQYGDLLSISGSITAKTLKDKRVVYSIYSPQINRVENDRNFFYQIASYVRRRVTSSMNNYLSSDQAALLLGIVFGISSTLSNNIKHDFQKTGVTHVVAASGMNVTLLAGFLLPIFHIICNRRKALMLTIVGLVCYAFISGMSASIVRATLMASIGYIGLMVGRQRTACISFFLTGALMLLWSPALFFDIGFQLSFAATAGMLVIRPILPSMAKIPLLRLVEEDLTATLSAQLTTLPIILYYFHAIGLLSLVVNMLILWTIPPLMIIGSGAAIISLLNLQLGGVIALLGMPFLSYFMIVVKMFASITPVFSLTHLPLWTVCLYYLLGGGCIAWLHRVRQRRLSQ